MISEFLDLIHAVLAVKFLTCFYRVKFWAMFRRFPMYCSIQIIFTVGVIYF